MRQKALSFARKNRHRFLEDLKRLVRIPSVSFPGFPPKEVQRSAEAVASLFVARGLENVRLLRIGRAHPYVVGDWLHALGRPTLLLYAHHDVQPPGRQETWKSPPFEPIQRGGRLYGRGSADDKAGVVVHTSAIASYLRTAHRLPLNVKVIAEGEEEIGSEHLGAFLERYASRLQADGMVLTDTNNFDTGLPSLTTSLRGLAAVDVEVRTADHPLHSGMWGGPLPDPVQALCKMVASLSDRQGGIAIPGIYDKVRALTPKERRELQSLRYTDRSFVRQAQVAKGVQVVGGRAMPLVKMWRLPSLSVNAIQSSSRANVANIINATAWCRVGIRIVPEMDPRVTLRRLKGHLKRNAPWGVQVHFSEVVATPWWETRAEGPAFEAAREAMRKGFGQRAVAIGCGGSIPFVGPFSKALGGAPALLVGVEDPYTNAHSENESLHLGDFQKSILSSIHLYQEIAERL